MFHCPVCSNDVSEFLPFGIIPRINAKCPICGSLERHRFAWEFFKRKTDLFVGKQKTMLHVAPEICISKKLSEIPNLKYISSDLVSKRAMVQMDLRQINYPDRSFDVIYCSHVLEHIPEDYLAISELKRVLKKGGWAFFQVPVYGETTFEDFSITEPCMREKIFGQHDHVRKYGSDFLNRLKDRGFYGKYFGITDLLDSNEASLYGLKIGNSVRSQFGFLCI